MTTEIPSLRALTQVLGISSEYSTLLAEAWAGVNQTAEKIQVGDAALWHYQDNWDSDNFGVSVWKVTSAVGTAQTEIAEVIQKLVSPEKYTYIVFRLDQTASIWIQEIEKQGGLLLDGSMDLFCSTPAPKSVAAVTAFNEAISTVIVPYSHEHKAQVLECAQAFGSGRFFSDPEFKVGEKVYTSWIENTLNGKVADTVLVALEKNKVVGFVAIKEKVLGSKKYLYIPLIAKHPACTLKGMGSVLLEAVLKQAAQQQLAGVSLGTQTSNLAALRSYTKMGFLPYASEFTLRILCKLSI